jgi:hypothetical protein
MLELSGFLEECSRMRNGRVLWLIGGRGHGAGGALAVVAALLMPAVATAQPPRSNSRKPSQSEIRRLDAKLQEAHGLFVRETADLVSSYEALGQFDRAKAIVEALGKLDPENEAVKAKIAELERLKLESGMFEVDLMPGKGWQAIGGVAKGDMIRVQISGDYRFQLAGETTAGGLAGDDPQNDLINGIPFGAVMGVIAAASPPGGKQKDEVKPRPFVVGASYDARAESDGVLYLKPNLPPGATCTGKLKATITGPKRPDER